MNGHLVEIQQQIAAMQHQLAALDAQRERLATGLVTLQEQLEEEAAKPLIENTLPLEDAAVTNASLAGAKLALVRRLFRGREDVYARRWESAKTGKSGYQPACRNEWVAGMCDKRRVKCADCPQREFLPLTDTVWRDHILGYEQVDHGGTRDFVAGVYPMLCDETCWFLAADFDKAVWREDAAAFLETCHIWEVPGGLERSRSGNGGHVWIFFTQAVPVTLARQLGAFLVTATMQRRPELGFDSYDRFFPNQDTMPIGGFGNLIALPLQGAARKQGNTLFIHDNFEPYLDQWAFLSSLQPLPRSKLEEIVEQAQLRGEITGVRMVVASEDEEEPWRTPPSHRPGDILIEGPLPERIELVLGNQIYLEKAGLSPALRNSLIRLAAFQNPEFFKAQAMRLPVFGKPRIISCAQDYAKHLALPRGLLDEAMELLQSLGISVTVRDERYAGTSLSVQFQGILTTQQDEVAGKLLATDTGVLAASTAFGKTVVAINVIAQRAVNTLILVHRQQLLDQWVARLQTFLDIDPKLIGRISGGKHRPTGVIDVALLQSLCRKGMVDDLVGGYGHLVVDECHHISAASFEQVAREAKARYVLGLSATPFRKDGHHPIIFMQCGPVRFKDSASDRAAAQPFTHQLIVRQTGFTLPPEIAEQAHPAIQDINRSLIADGPRNRKIVDDIVLAVRAGRSPVVITERTEHLELLNTELHDQVANVVVLKGGMGMRQRKAVMERLAEIGETGERVIIATGRYLGEGFDDARLDTLFLTMPVSWKGTLQQYAGRLHRQHASKTRVQIYDYADLGVPLLAKMHQRRLAGYRALGYEQINSEV